MKRRAFITLLGGAAVAWPPAARAQQPALPVVGLVNTGSRESAEAFLMAFRQGLRETGYVEGQNVTIDYYWLQGRYDRVPMLMVDLARRPVAVIVAAADTLALPAKAATTTIPIVFITANNLVEFGLVASLSRPGGNLTGVTNLNVALVPKRLELLCEVVPDATEIALLMNPTAANADTVIKDGLEAARLLGRRTQILRASSQLEIDAAFSTLVQQRVGGLLIGADAYFNSRSEQLGALTVRYAVPAIFQTREFAVAGGLMSYEANRSDLWRQTGAYTGRILKGEKPADMPVQQSTKVDLILNLKTARSLRLTVPLALLGRADEVIE
jgi:putative ABC transport system substrate-binding protein